MSEANASDTTQSMDTRVAHQILLDGLSNLKNAMDEMSIDRKIEVGSILWEIGDHVKDILDGIKTEVRQEAVKQCGGEAGTVNLDGDDMGEAQVIIVPAALRIPKGKDIGSLKEALGKRFSFFFEESVSYKPQREFEERVSAVSDPLEQKILLDSVDRTELTPRVLFRRNKPSKRDENGDSEK